MRQQPGLFDGQPGDHLRPTWTVRAVFAALTPNLVVGVCRAGLVAVILLAAISGPGSSGDQWLWFAISYVATLLAICAFPNWHGRYTGAGLAIVFCAYSLFCGVGDRLTMMLVELAGIACALAPLYARNIGRLAGSDEGHISFTERRIMWRRHRETSRRAALDVASTTSIYPPPDPPLLEFRAESAPEPLQRRRSTTSG